jgi:protein YIPF1/2
MPTFIYFFFRWRLNRVEYTFLELLCIYGYSLTIFIPVSVLWIIPIHWLQWTLTVVASLMSGSVLIVTFWPSVNSDQHRFSALSIVVVLLAHLLMAVCIMLVFFHISDKNIYPNSDTTLTSSLASTTVSLTTKKA